MNKVKVCGCASCRPREKYEHAERFNETTLAMIRVLGPAYDELERRTADINKFPAVTIGELMDTHQLIDEEG